MWFIMGNLKNIKNACVMTFIVVAACAVCLTPARAEEQDGITAQYELLSSSITAVRLSEVQRIGMHRVKEAVPALIDLLADDESAVRIAVVIALAKIRDGSAAGAMIEVMQNDDSLAVRVMTAQAIMKFETDEVREALSQVAVSTYSILRSAAVRSLGRTGGKKEVKIILERMGEDESGMVRKAAVAALSNIVIRGREGEDNRGKIEKAFKKASRDKDEKVSKDAERASRRLKKLLEKKEGK